MTVKRCGGAFNVTVSGSTQFNRRIELRLGENKVALAQHAKVSFIPNSVAELVQVHTFLSANPDDTSTNTNVEEFDQTLKKPAVFYHDNARITESVALLGGAVLFRDQGLPLYGFPLVGDFSCFGWINQSAGNNLTVLVSLWYMEKKVTREEWLRLTKRQRSAPRDTMPDSVFNT